MEFIDLIDLGIFLFSSAVIEKLRVTSDYKELARLIGIDN